MVVAVGVRHAPPGLGGDLIATAVAGVERVARVAAVTVLILYERNGVAAVPVSGVAFALLVGRWGWRLVVGLRIAPVLVLLALVLVVLLALLLLVLLARGPSRSGCSISRFLPSRRASARRTAATAETLHAPRRFGR
jgi:hypothetical protein